MPELQKSAFENFSAIDGILVKNLDKEISVKRKNLQEKVENDFLGNLLLWQQRVSRSAFRWRPAFYAKEFDKQTAMIQHENYFGVICKSCNMCDQSTRIYQ